MEQKKNEFITASTIFLSNAVANEQHVIENKKTIVSSHLEIYY